MHQVPRKDKEKEEKKKSKKAPSKWQRFAGAMFRESLPPVSCDPTAHATPWRGEERICKHSSLCGSAIGRRRRRLPKSPLSLRCIPYITRSCSKHGVGGIRQHFLRKSSAPGASPDEPRSRGGGGSSQRGGMNFRMPCLPTLSYGAYGGLMSVMTVCLLTLMMLECTCASC